MKLGNVDIKGGQTNSIVPQTAVGNANGFLRLLFFKR